LLRVTSTIDIPESELSEEFIRASGPGGQNVNKVSTAVKMRFDAARSPSLPAAVRARLMRLAGRTGGKSDGVIEPLSFVSCSFNSGHAGDRSEVGLLSAMYGRRPRCKRNLTFPRMSGAVMYSACCCSHFGRWP
jgi:hypothetical protein